MSNFPLGLVDFITEIQEYLSINQLKVTSEQNGVQVPILENGQTRASVAVELLDGSYRWDGQTLLNDKPVYNHKGYANSHLEAYLVELSV